METQAIRVRYAPSPTGDPHIGNIRTSLFAFLFARHNKGTVVLRIEDTDKSREVPGSIDRIKDSLTWLGLDWDEGPFLQSQRLPLYQEAAQELVDNGKAYYCFCTEERLAQMREQQMLAHKPAMYDKHCRVISRDEAKERAKTEKYVIRLKVPESGETVVHDLIRGDIHFQNNVIDDQVLLKSDGFPTYHLAVVVDDHDMKISHVIRGDDWLPSFPKHILLYSYFGWQPPVFVHAPLIVGVDRKKLSKRLGDMSLLSYKDQGYLSSALVNFIVRLGYSPKDDRKLYALDELIAEFNLEKLHINPAIFDLEKLQWFNRLAKEQGQQGQDLEGAITDLLEKHNVVKNPLTESQFTFIKEAAKRIDTISDAEDMLHYLWQTPVSVSLDDHHKQFSKETVEESLSSIEQALGGLSDWTETAIGNALRDKARNQKALPSKYFYQLITIAVTGAPVSPPLFSSLAMLGKDAVLSRIKSAKDTIA